MGFDNYKYTSMKYERYVLVKKSKGEYVLSKMTV